MARRLIAAFASSLVLVALGASAQGASASPYLPPGWTHVTINVVIDHVAYTITYDRGIVVSVSSSSLVLRERDGTLWTIDVSPATVITIDGQPATLAAVRPREDATTKTVDGGPATTVAVTIPPGLAAAIAGAVSRQPARITRAATRGGRERA